MTVHARRVASVPRRSSVETWRRVCELVSAPGSAARSQLEQVTGVAAMVIADECTREAPIVFSGGGPQVRVYTLHGDDAIAADLDDETCLAFDPTAGNWSASLPCAGEDVAELSAMLESSARVTVRDVAAGATVGAAGSSVARNARPIIDLDELDSA